MGQILWESTYPPLPPDKFFVFPNSEFTMFYNFRFVFFNMGGEHIPLF